MMRRRSVVTGVPSDYGLRVATAPTPDGRQGLISVFEAEAKDGSQSWVVESSDYVADGEIADTMFTDRAELDSYLQSLHVTWLPDTFRVLEMHERRFPYRIRYRGRPTSRGGQAPLRDRPGLSWSNVRWSVRGHWRFVTGRTGEFARGEWSDRSRMLDDLWDSGWPQDEPEGAALRRSHTDRWVRFHSLPDSKEYADSEDEYAELVRRHRTVLSDLLSSEDVESLIVLASDWGRKDVATGEVKRHLPEAWPWRSFSGAGDDGDRFVWVVSGATASRLDALLRMAADEETSFVLSNRGLDWMYCPYPSGADVILSHQDARDELASRYVSWLPAKPDH